MIFGKHTADLLKQRVVPSRNGGGSGRQIKQICNFAPHSRRQLFANAAIAASRVASFDLCRLHYRSVRGRMPVLSG
jgi:hypothetical protein